MIARHLLRVRVLTLCPRHPLFISRSTSRYVSSRLSSTVAEKKSELAEPHPSQSAAQIYNGPLSATFKRLKIFSLGSLGLSITLAPFMFLVESSLPVPARLALASIAIGTSGLSTALVGWCGKPYVYTLKRLKTEGGREGLELFTYSLILRSRITRVWDKNQV